MEKKLKLKTYFLSIMVLLFLFFSIPKVYANEVCESVYFFLINHLDNNGNLNYTNQDIEIFINNTGISNQTARNHISNFSICEASLNIKLPKPKYSNSVINKQNEDYYCPSSIEDTTFLGIISMEETFPRNKEFFIIQNVSCSKIKFYKEYLNIKQIDNDTYVIKGIRIWWIVFLFLFILILLFFYVVYKNIKGEKLFEKIVKQNDY